LTYQYICTIGCKISGDEEHFVGQGIVEENWNQRLLLFALIATFFFPSTYIILFTIQQNASFKLYLLWKK